MPEKARRGGIQIEELTCYRKIVIFYTVTRKKVVRDEAGAGILIGLLVENSRNSHLEVSVFPTNY